MLCPKCGSQVYDNAKFCNSCGSSINNVSSDNKGGLLSIKKEQKTNSNDNNEKSNISYTINDIKQSENSSNNDNDINIIEVYPDNKENDYSNIKKNRNFIIYLILTIITSGLYTIYFWHKFIKDMNIICGEEGESPNIILVLIFSCMTFGIYYLYWIYKHSERIKNTAASYNVVIKQSSKSILLLTIAGTIFSFVFSVLFETIFTLGFGILLGQYFMITNFNKLTNAITKGV